MTSFSSSLAPNPENLASQVSYSDSFSFSNRQDEHSSQNATVDMSLTHTMPPAMAGFKYATDMVFLDHTQPTGNDMQASTSQVSWDTSSSSYDRCISDAGRSSPMVNFEHDQDQDHDPNQGQYQDQEHNNNILVPVKDERRCKRTSRYINANPEALARRREQNRKSQRNYRQRKEYRILELEAQLNNARKREEKLSHAYSNLQAEYSRLFGENTASSCSTSISSPSLGDEPLPSLNFDCQPL